MTPNFGIASLERVNHCMHLSQLHFIMTHQIDTFMKTTSSLGAVFSLKINYYYCSFILL